jgi:hypothetical protein
MLLEEFYNYDGNRDKLSAEDVYLTTLQHWLIYNDFDIYESLLITFEQKENYIVCAGIRRALQRIEDTMDRRFEQAEKIRETEEEVVYTHEEHQRISRLIFEDILGEIYEKQISKYQKDN